MKARSEVATRYAKALFSMSTNGKKDAALVDLRKAYEAFFNNKETMELISSPVITRHEKSIVAEKVLSSLSLMDEVANFIRVLAKKDRLQMLDQIMAAYEEISDKSNNVLRGMVWSAEKLSDAEQKQIEGSISKVTGRQLILDYEENKNLIGGIVANVGSYSFDGSLKTHLRKLKDNLKVN